MTDDILDLMGRWAQARRRGGGVAHGVVLGPPPAPTLAEDAGSLIQTATGGSDVDGVLVLLISGVTGGPYAEVDTASWTTPWDWGSLAILVEGYYVATETGNGVDYVGVSGYSNEFDHS